jgi:hypothetical protein
VKTHKPTGAALLPVYQEKGELFTKLKLLDQAFSYLDKAVDVCNRNHGPDDRRTATALVNVGKLHVLKGTFAESVFFYRSALRIRRQVRDSMSCSKRSLLLAKVRTIASPLYRCWDIEVACVVPPFLHHYFSKSARYRSPLARAVILQLPVELSSPTLSMTCKGGLMMDAIRRCCRYSHVSPEQRPLLGRCWARIIWTWRRCTSCAQTRTTAPAAR